MLGVFMLLDYLLRRFHENFFKTNQKPVAEEGAPWQLACEKLEQRCGFLLTSGLWTDCSFMVGSEINQEVIQAHKLVLAMASPVFESMFFGDLSEPKDQIVRIPDVQPGAFRALLQLITMKFNKSIVEEDVTKSAMRSTQRFVFQSKIAVSAIIRDVEETEYVYTGNINIGSLKMAWNLFYGAKKYMLPHLEKECIRYIWSEVGQSNAARPNEFGLDEKTLMDYIQIISKNGNEVPNDSFDDLTLNVLSSVSSLDCNMETKLDLFYALTRYAEEQRRRGEISSVDQHQTRLEAPTSEEKVLLNVERSCETSPALELESKPLPEVLPSKPTAEKDNLKEVVPAQDFPGGPGCSALLTDAEKRLVESIASSFSDVAPPAGCSGGRERRQPRSDSNDQLPEVGSIEHIINELKSGDPARVKAAVEAAGNILRTPHSIQPALDMGMLDALIPALSDVVYRCQEEAARAIFNLCEWGSTSQLEILAASAALQPYCKLLAAGGHTCYYVLCGLTHLLQKVEQQNTETLHGKLRKFDVEHNLLLLQQLTSGMNCKLATNLLQSYFGAHIHSNSVFGFFG